MIPASICVMLYFRKIAVNADEQTNTIYIAFSLSFGYNIQTM